jgi:phosphoenolpyruvate-protein kinase (PTS system EI component)
MSGQTLAGLPASPGLAAGAAALLDVAIDVAAAPLPVEAREAEASAALSALSAAAAELDELAAELARQGKTADAEIISTGSLMAADPGLTAAVRTAVIDDGADAGAAILEATATYAATLAALDDPMLALRSDDVRSLGRRAARLAMRGRAESNGATRAGGGATRAGGGARGASGAPHAAGERERGDDAILVASDLGPADVVELDAGVRAVALAAGGTTAHAAIVARSLGLPMVVGVGERLLQLVGSGTPVVVDGDTGSVAIAPDLETLRRADAAAATRRRERERTLVESSLPAETVDGRRIRVLANVATAVELDVALPAGADGVGLLRTELAFLEATNWPTEEEHRHALAPMLARLAGTTATVRLLDFGGDKTPPFLAGTELRGIELLLAAPEALASQVRALVAVAGDVDLRVLLPMVEDPEQVEIVRALVTAVTHLKPVLGAMIETQTAVERLDEIAAATDFLSIGTNDLTHSILATNRFAPGETAAHHPRVLTAVAATARAAATHQRVLEVCGEAASNPIAMPLLLGLGVDELSVGAARVGAVRHWVRTLDYSRARELATTAAGLDSASAVADLLQPTAGLLAQVGDAPGECVNGGVRVGAVGRQA